MEGVWAFALSGLVFGLSSGAAPGPLLTLTISETVRHGLAGGLRVALAPILTDGPLILLTLFLLTRLEGMDTTLGLLSLVGAGFLSWLAWESFRVQPNDGDTPERQPRSLLRGVLTNLLNPAPYMFWVTVGTPTLIEAHRASLTAALAYVSAFFISIVLSKAVVALLTARFRDFLRSRIYLWLMRFLGLTLAAFAVVFLYRAALLLGLLS
ncbi:MAG: LysE family translocator [Acidobacteriota bacterium]|nr:LysE family translocator [Acidobacteriota bacterium]